MKRMLLLLALVLPMVGVGQNVVEPVTYYIAYVMNYNDTLFQRIFIEWSPSATTNVMGYHICTGDPCLDYDTVYGRGNLNYVCIDQSPNEPHLYRIHAFDSAYNVSALTPFFGPAVLSAEVPECESTVHLTWTPYIGLPGGVASYRLIMFSELETGSDMVEIFTTDSLGPYRFDYDIPDTMAGPLFFFLMVNGNRQNTFSQSNTVWGRRGTEAAARWLTPMTIEGDATNGIALTFSVDTLSPSPYFTLYRSIDRGPWVDIAHLQPDQPPLLHYLDRAVNPYDSLYCYRIGALDGCQRNEKFSDPLCLTLPPPPDTHMYLPNAILVGDPDNGLFCPMATGLKGDLYELYIYDRLGRLVFTSTDPASPWNPLDTHSPQGAYAYTLRVRYINNIVKQYSGTVTVLR